MGQLPRPVGAEVRVDDRRRGRAAAPSTPAMTVGATNSSRLASGVRRLDRRARARGARSPDPVHDGVVAALDAVPALVAIHRPVAAADRRDRGRPDAPRPAAARARRRTRAPTTAACRGRRAARGRGQPARARARASSASATRCRSWACTPPGPTRPTTCAAARPRVPAPQAASRAGRVKNEPSAIAASIRGRSWSTGLPAPMFRWPTSELPICPGGSPTASSDARSDRVRPACQQPTPDGHPSRGDRVGRRVAPDAEPVDDDEHDGSRPRGSPPPSPMTVTRRARVPRGQPRPCHDARHLVGLERRAADERAVDRRLGEELIDVRGRDAAAIQDRTSVAAHARHGPERRVEGAPDRDGHLGRVGAARVPPGPDRPHRLVRDDQPARRRGRCRYSSAARRAPGRPRAPRPPARPPHGPRGPRRRTGSAAAPPRSRGSASRRRCSFVSWCQRRRSEWPTITQVASPSSIDAAMSPVNAPTRW